MDTKQNFAMPSILRSLQNAGEGIFLSSSKRKCRKKTRFCFFSGQMLWLGSKTRDADVAKSRNVACRISHPTGFSCIFGHKIFMMDFMNICSRKIKKTESHYREVRVSVVPTTKDFPTQSWVKPMPHPTKNNQQVNFFPSLILHSRKRLNQAFGD